MKRLVCGGMLVSAVCGWTMVHEACGGMPADTECVEGIVKDAEGHPLADALVEASINVWDSSSEELKVTAKTDRNGVFTLGDLPPSFGMKLCAGHEGYCTLTKKIYVCNCASGRKKRIAFSLQPEKTIRGRAMGPSGEALEGITMTARIKERPANETAARQAEVSASTDKEGTYTIRSLSPGAYSVEARSDRYAVQEIGPVPSGAEHADFALRDAGVIRGVIREGKGGKPLPGAVVSVEAEKGDYRGAGIKTDGNGAYAIPSLRTGSYTVEVAARGYVWARRTGIAVREGETVNGIDLPLSPKTRVRGTVTLDSGGPAQGAALTLEEVWEGIGSSGSSRSGAEVAVTDGQGTYEISDVKATGWKPDGITPGATYRIIAGLEGYAPALSAPLQFVPGAELEGIDLVLAKGLSLTGKVVDAGGKPVRDAEVSVSPQRGMTGGHCHTDEAGTFTLAGLPAGPKEVRAEAGGYQSGKTSVWLDDKSGAKPLTIVLAPGLVISGRVTDGSGNPVPDARVRARIGSERSHSGTTDDAGFYTINDLRPGRYAMSACLWGYAEESVKDIEAPRENVDLVLLPDTRSRIVGKVLDGKTGAPVTSFSFDAGKHVNFDRQSRKPLEYHDGGIFESDPLDPGKYGIVIMARGNAPEMIEETELKAGKDTDVEIRLLPASSIAGRIIAEKTGAAVNGVSVDVFMAKDRRFKRMSDKPFLSDSSGSFEIPEMPKGEFKVRVRHPDYAEETRDVTLKGEGAAGRLDFALRKKRTVSVVVTREGTSSLVAGASVSISDTKCRAVSPAGRGVHERTAVTDSSGCCEFTNIPPGERWLTATHADGTAELKRIVVSPDADLPKISLTISSGARLSGTVRDRHGKPMPMNVSAGTPDDWRSTGTDEQGRYEFMHLRPGAYRVDVGPLSRWSHEKGRSEIEKKAVLETGDDLVVDFTFESGFSVSGKVLRGGAPAQDIRMMFEKEDAEETDRMEGYADSNGDYRMDNLPAGNYKIQLSAEQGDMFVQVPAVVVDNLAHHDITIPGGAGGIAVTVVDERGAPKKGARINLRSGSEDENGAYFCLAQESDREGRCTFSNLKADRYELAEGDVCRATVTLASDSSSAEIQLAPAPRYPLDVKIVDPGTGKDVAEAALRLYGNDGAAPIERTIPDKNEKAKGVPAGTYRIEAASPGNLYGSVDNVRVGPGAKGEVEVTLREGGMLAVTVTDDAKRPLPSAIIELWDAAGKKYLPLLQESDILTNSKGIARCRNLPAGRYTIKAKKKGCAPADAVVSIEGGKEKSVAVTMKK